MKHFSVIALLVMIASTQAVLNGPCSSKSGFGSGVGVCISTSDCSNKGGTSTPGFCPGTPTNVQCCTKSPCTSVSLGEGVCRFTSSCPEDHYSITGLCPGPTNYKCCAPCTVGSHRIC
ncbi:hypothetical protein B0H19DRAFT_967522 [Mycena capillaripes]|nr:hypothetical protein B0H19DRAFT_967522 [Mycena capillaripes]